VFELLAVERAFLGRWRYYFDDLAILRWLLNRQNVAVTAAYDVDGDTHAVSEGFSKAVSFLFDHKTAARLSCQQLRRALGSREPVSSG
jgi:hypothetical protein